MPAFQDLRYGARLLAKAPAFTAVAVATLALGIGAAASIFGVVDTVLLKPLPFADATRLLAIWEGNPAVSSETDFAAPANYREWRRQAQSFEAFAAAQPDVHVNLTAGPGGRAGAEELRAERISAGLLPMLGVKPALGRGFAPGDDQPGCPGLALLSHALWQRRFGGDAAILGKSIRLRGDGFTVIGVMPPRFAILSADVDIWLPLALESGDPLADRRRDIEVIARLRPRATLERARAEMATIGDRLEAAEPALDKGWRPVLVPLREELAGKAERPLLMLMAAVSLLLLMACANIASLLLARSTGRSTEIAIRRALGASRGRIVLQLLSESMLLALGGGALGAALAWGGIRLLARFGPRDIPRLAEASADARVLLFTLAVSLTVGLLFGLAPAVQASEEKLNAVLVARARGGIAGRRGRLFRKALVAFEMALAVVVLIAAGLLARSFARLRAADPGFDPSNLLSFRIPMAGGRNAARERRAIFLDQLEERVSALPGVRAVGAVNTLPFGGLGVGAAFAVAGRPAPPPGQRPLALLRAATPGYWRAIGIPLIAGRVFSAADSGDAARVAIVNSKLARRYWPAGDAVGGHLTLDMASSTVVEIVGVVGDTRPERLEGEDWPTVYVPFRQSPPASMTVVARGALPPRSLAGEIERAVHELDSEQPVADVRPMEDTLSRVLAAPRFDMALLGILAQIAFALAAIGIYGVISYDVGQRTNELGIRAALGARPAALLALVLKQAAVLAACGIAVGVAAAFALTRLMKDMLYQTGSADAWTFTLAPLLLAAVALLACYIPARRAMALDPATALRHE